MLQSNKTHWEKAKAGFKFFLKRFYLFMRDTERGRDIGRGRSRLPAGSLMWDLIPGPRVHTLSQRQTLNHWATQASHQEFRYCFSLENTKNNDSVYFISLVSSGRKARIAVWMKEEGSIVGNSDEQTGSKLTIDSYSILIFGWITCCFMWEGKHVTFPYLFSGASSLDFIS